DNARNTGVGMIAGTRFLYPDRAPPVSVPTHRHPDLALRAVSGHRRGRVPIPPFDAKGPPPMKVRVYVSSKNGVLDPQGRAIHHASEGLGFSGVNDVRAGRMIELDVDATVTDEALDDMARKSLANMVIENYRIE
ncbi:hypothetical protein OY671_011945, partial [Metschnikowia pulcherrima]